MSIEKYLSGKIFDQKNGANDNRSLTPKEKTEREKEDQLELDENFEEQVLGMEYTFKKLLKEIGSLLAKLKRKFEKKGLVSISVDEMCKEFDKIPREIPSGMRNVDIDKWLRPKLIILRNLEQETKKIKDTL